MIEALGSKPCAASNKVRSLNFPHGLLQVSSRTIGASARCAGGRAGWRSRAKQPSVEPGFSTYACIYRLSATIGRRANKPNRRKCCGRGNAYTAATKLLNFASALTRPFRIVWTVTILQQAIPRFCRAVSDATIRQTLQRRSNRESRRPVACRRVEQRLALFPYLRATPKLAQY